MSRFQIRKVLSETFRSIDCQTPIQALYWMRQAAEQGHRAAQYELGSYYTLGDSADYDQALRWLRNAALQGHAEAQFSVGMLYRTGLGTVRDLPIAYAWLRLALLNGDQEADDVLTTMMKRMNEEERERADSFMKRIIARLRGVAEAHQSTRSIINECGFRCKNWHYLIR